MTVAELLLDGNKVYSAEEVADLLRVSRGTITRALRSGHLKGFKVGRLWRVWGHAVGKYINSESSGRETTRRGEI